jgi:hypothetical protein
MGLISPNNKAAYLKNHFFQTDLPLDIVTTAKLEHRAR